MGDEDSTASLDAMEHTYHSKKKQMLELKKKMLEKKLAALKAGTYKPFVDKKKTIDKKYADAVKAAAMRRKHRIEFFKLWLKVEREGVANTLQDRTSTLREQMLQRREERLLNLRQVHLNMLLLPEPIRESEFVAKRKSAEEQLKEERENTLRPLRNLPRRSAPSAATAESTTAGVPAAATKGEAGKGRATAAAAVIDGAAKGVKEKRRASEQLAAKKEKGKERGKTKEARHEHGAAADAPAVDGKTKPVVHVGPCVIYQLAERDIMDDIKTMLHN